MIQGFLAGNIGKDAETRDVGNGGETVTKFSVACNTGKKDETQWVTCSMWGERGAKLRQYLTKGTRVAVTGRVSARAWKDKSGETRVDIEVRVGELSLLGGGEKASHEERPARRAEPAVNAFHSTPAPANRGDAYDDDDIPF